MTVVSVEHALAGKIPAGGEVTVRGWVRTRRDSKAGLSFVHLSDGSCFAPIQVVAPDTLANYESEVKHLSTACATVWRTRVAAAITLVRGRRCATSRRNSSECAFGWMG